MGGVGAVGAVGAVGGDGREYLGGTLKVSEEVGVMGGVGVVGGMRIMERLPQSQRVGAAGYVNTN